MKFKLKALHKVASNKCNKSQCYTNAMLLEATHCHSLRRRQKFSTKFQKIEHYKRFQCSREQGKPERYSCRYCKKPNTCLLGVCNPQTSCMNKKPPEVPDPARQPLLSLLKASKKAKTPMEKKTKRNACHC